MNYAHLENSQAFEARLKSEFVSRFKSVYLPLGAAAVLLLGAVDYFLFPQQFQSFLLVRMLSIPVAGLCYYAKKFELFRTRYYTAPALFTAVYLSFLHWYLIFNSGSENSPHFTGLVLSTVFLIGNLPWKNKYLPVIFAVMWGPFVGQLFLLEHIQNPAHVVSDFFMLGLSAFCSLTFHVIMWKHRISEFQLVNDLENLTLRQAETIEKKTQEGIYLEKLSSQFSPQVIQSIKDGTINLDSKIRREVACLFIDVQNSTHRGSRLDHQSYSSLLTEFFSECVRILLKHNVTVGTYQGDGVMAITNAPSEDPRFRENAIAASFEVLQFLEKNRKNYFEKWRTDFNVRIGIESGWTTIGFFPSRQYGTYTALGDSTNLAARLCSRAPLNSVAVTKTFLSKLSLPDGTLNIHDLGQVSDFKGFEGEVFEVCSLRPELKEPVKENDCPNCDISMEVVSIQVGGTFLKCPQCNFRKISTLKIANGSAA